MAGRNLYIGDWHYGHGNVLAFDNRPFKNVDEMNAELIRRWNEAVDDRDTVYVLGDMFWKGVDAVSVLKQLKGKKVFIKGNHDRCKDPAFVNQFELVADYLEVYDKTENRWVVLCHYPIPCFKNHFYGWAHLYAHVHTSFESNMMERDRWLMRELYERPCDMYNVGAMMPWMDYTPRTFGEIWNYQFLRKEDT